MKTKEIYMLSHNPTKGNNKDKTDIRGSFFLLLNTIGATPAEIQKAKEEQKKIEKEQKQANQAAKEYETNRVVAQTPTREAPRPSTGFKNR
jgi:hypothetical protein